MPIKVAIVPGNGGGDVKRCNWYAWARVQFDVKLKGVSAHLRNMPDPVVARESIWLPFMRSELNCGPDSIIIGHSSGAAAAMRFAETSPVLGIVLVGAYVSDLGDDNERESGYFSRPWDWAKIRSNAGFIVQFASRDDPFLPWSEQETVAEELQSELYAYDDRGHFQDETLPELSEAVWRKIDEINMTQS